MSKEIAKRFIDFVNQTGSPYHSVAACKSVLKAAGFTPLSEKASHWPIIPGGKYYITRDHSEIFAFVVGERVNLKSDSSGLVMIGAHTDSPCLMMRPHSAQGREKHLQLGVATYGGGLWHTWFDRGLGMAGKIVYRTESGGLGEKLVRIARPICIVPNLAIHLLSNEERKAFDVNPENHLMPVIATSKRVKDDQINGHHKAIMSLLAKEANIDNEDRISDLTICLMDAQPAEFVGIDEEFISTGRIDNQLSTWAAIDALASGDLSEHDICIAAAFNHEEVGSNSATGADSNTAVSWINKIIKSLDDTNDVQSIMSRSVLVSADCAHAIHPNYATKHQSEHKVYMQSGLVFKANPNQRYSTTSVTSAMAREICKRENVQVQDFVVRNDSPCGSTIGPMLSAILGVRSIDIGAPQWAMHSCRETCGVDDVANIRNACNAFYKHWRAVDSSHQSVDEEAIH